MPVKSPKRRTLQRALRLLWQAAPGWTLTSIALIPMQALLTTLPIYYSKLVVDAVAFSIRFPHDPSVLRPVCFYIILQAGIALLSTGLAAVANQVRTRQTTQFSDYIAEVIHSKSIELDLNYYEDARYYDTLRRVQNQSYSHPISIINYLLTGAQSALSLLALLGLLISLHWGIAVLLFVSTLPAALVNMRYSRHMYGWQRSSTSTERQAYYIDSLLSGGSSAKEVRIFDLGALLIKRARELRLRLRQERLKLEASKTLATFGAQALAIVAMYGSYVMAAYRTWQGVTTLGGLTMYFAAFQRGQGLLQQVLTNMTGLYDSSLFLTDLEEFLTMEPRVKEPDAPVPVPRPMQSGIRFEQVGFLYPGSNHLALEDITLQIRPGEMIALVGENGSGKTTLTKLLCRLYDPECGHITLDGIDLRQFTIRELRSQISVLFQDYEKYQVSASENIWFGNVALAPDPQQIQRVAQLSGADDVIMGLEQGYDTILGKMFEGGTELSIGQWQKIALARAFLREAQLIVLDEPTSALDAKAEYEFFRDFRTLAKGCATVLVSHRFSTVRMADCIYVLENGRIVERGTHNDLVQQNGMYARLFEMQAQHYR